MKTTILLILSLFIVSCGSTQIISNEPRADIYMDNKYLGKGMATIKSIGAPNEAILEARLNGKVIGRTVMSRRFTTGTFFIGLFTYYTGWYWAWYYPDDALIPIFHTQSADSLYISPWMKLYNGPWTTPN